MKLITQIKQLDQPFKQYLLITFNYWNFTLTDGALRMLVLLYFHQLGYSPTQVAMLFLLYECCGIFTNLFAGWIGARIGLNRIMNLGLLLQVLALLMLTVTNDLLSVPYVMLAQALSGIAKDLNKMSAKSSIKSLVTGDESSLYKWVALLTGSKNALKGIGFFLGGLLLSTIGFRPSLWLMAGILLVVLLLSLKWLTKDLGKAKIKPKFKHIISKNHNVNFLSAARLFLFAARDIWFVVALPIYLSSHFSWSQTQVGGFMALWIIAYGFVQSLAPRLTKGSKSGETQALKLWVILLTICTLLIAISLILELENRYFLSIGLMVFGVFFAINSSLHSYLILKFSRNDGGSLDVGFYYMANATGRLIGTLLSGLLFQWGGMVFALAASTGFLAISSLITHFLKNND